MPPNLLVLGGTTEATKLCRALAEHGFAGTVSFAGRVEQPPPQPLPRRVGGFGGVAGLVTYLRRNRITHVIDATHPFAAQMSANAAVACAETGVPLVALTRMPWQLQPGDNWRNVADIPAAVAALRGRPRRVMLAIGRMHLADFSENPQHFYLLRTVDRPAVPPPFPDHHLVVARGPFEEDGDRLLITSHGIDLIVSKNSGGTAAYAKIAAARSLRLPVLMIDRPLLPPRTEVFDVGSVLDWIAHSSTDRGV